MWLCVYEPLHWDHVISTTERKSRPDKSKTCVLWTCLDVWMCACAHTSYIKLCVVVNRGLTCQLAQTLRRTAVHHQAQRTVLDQQLNCVEKAVVHRLHTVTNTQTKRTEVLSMVPIMINYCWILHQMGELKRNIGNAWHKTDSKHFQVKHFFFPLFCWVCKLTKVNDREMREICWNVLRQKTDWLEQRSLNRGLKRCFLTWEFWSMNRDVLEPRGEI